MASPSSKNLAVRSSSQSAEAHSSLNIFIPAEAGTQTSVRIKTRSERRGGATFFAMRAIAPCVYILASRPNGTLYIGVTSDLPMRMAQHAQKLIPGFTSRYDVTRLVYFDLATMPDAIRREKQLKEWHRAWKLRLIEQMNPGWVDLFDAATGEIAFGPFDG